MEAQYTIPCNQLHKLIVWDRGLRGEKGASEDNERRRVD